MAAKKIFIEVSNGDIYLKLVAIEKLLNKVNTRAQINRWIATTALSGVFLLLGFIIAQT